MATNLANSFSKDGTATAIIIPGKPEPLTVTYQHLNSDVAAFQVKLAKLGVAPGAAVSIALTNSYEFIVSFLAAAWQRAVAAPLNPAYRQDEFEFYIGDLSSVLVLVSRGSFAQDGPAVHAARKYQAAIAECYWDGNEVVLDIKDTGKLNGKGGHKVERAEPDDIALVLHTSGTTGRPKAVSFVSVAAKVLSTDRSHQGASDPQELDKDNEYTFGHLAFSAGTTKSCLENIQETYKLTNRDRTLLVMPLFHVHGLLAAFLAPLLSGGSVIVPTRFSASGFWSDFITYRANWYTAVPTIHQILLKSPIPRPIPAIRFIRSCSSPLSPKTFDELEKAFNAPVLEAYAMTEAAHQMTSNPLPPGKRKPGTVGIGQGVEVRILDQDGNEVNQGSEAEICVRGENVTRGYINNIAANKSSFTREGFFRTGDQGKQDRDGYLIITGRIKELINKGGEKISPIELDNTIAHNPHIAEAVSFAIPDAHYGEDIGVAMVLKKQGSLSEDDLKSWIAARVAKFKIPKKVNLSILTLALRKDQEAYSECACYE